MTFIVLLIGIVLVAVALKGTQGDLFTALMQDVPAFGKWAAAIVALGIIGYIPGLKPISRGLLGLVILVIVLNNYQKIIGGYQDNFSGKATSSGNSNSASNSSGTNANDIFTKVLSSASTGSGLDPFALTGLG